MALSAAYNIGPVVLNGTNIAGIQQSAASNGVIATNPVESGNLYPTFAAIVGMKQGIAFTARDVSALLAKTGTTGAAIASSTVAYFKKRGAVGPASGSVHRSYTVGNGLIIPVSMSCGHQGNASCSAAIVPVSSDGSTSAITIASTAALPSEPSSLSDLYTLYSATIAGTTVTGLTGVEVDFGVNARTVGSNSDLFDVVAGVVSAVPSITFRGVDLNWINASSSICDVLGEAVLHADTNFIFRRRGVSLGTSAHIKVTINGVAYGETLAEGGSSESEGTAAIRFTTCSANNTIAGIVLDLAYSN